MGIGFLELVIIGIAALVFIGPQKLPDVLRQIAKYYVQIKRTSNDFKSAFDHVVVEAEAQMLREEKNLQAGILNPRIDPPPADPIQPRSKHDAWQESEDPTASNEQKKL